MFGDDDRLDAAIIGSSWRQDPDSTQSFMMEVPSGFADTARHVLALEGRTVLYIESMQLYRVLVTHIEVHDDGNGFEALATLVPTHGMASGPPSWTFGAAWSYCHAFVDAVSASYGGWRIYTSSALMDELTEILKPLPAHSTFRDDYRCEPVGGNQRCVALGTPGPVATRVLEFLRNH